jgi:four helix bundle protein
MVKRFEDLEIWSKARELSLSIDMLTKKGVFRTDFELKDQINASIGSVMDNIAEGFERNGSNEFRQALSIAKGSCGETRSQLYRTFDKGYITQEEFERLKLQAEQISGKISNLISSINSSNLKGAKYLRK